ncbi:hypothetical protein HYFRA_00006966 [Hymenoscyphus fraxineus]|uniref:Uncharacterized protein n=1 Tax=Hymenoscyphus fraxineus TaxID=746836 RepID=A0A9N9KMF6_9HELO|nr:hypothetical protein HYFRA_00006966 [Hymenoscyphus fraxineus]
MSMRAVLTAVFALTSVSTVLFQLSQEWSGVPLSRAAAFEIFDIPLSLGPRLFAALLRCNLPHFPSEASANSQLPQLVGFVHIQRPGPYCRRHTVEVHRSDEERHHNTCSLDLNSVLTTLYCIFSRYSTIQTLSLSPALASKIRYGCLARRVPSTLHRRKSEGHGIMTANQVLVWNLIRLTPPIHLAHNMHRASVCFESEPEPEPEPAAVPEQSHTSATSPTSSSTSCISGSLLQGSVTPRSSDFSITQLQLAFKMCEYTKNYYIYTSCQDPGAHFFGTSVDGKREHRRQPSDSIYLLDLSIYDLRTLDNTVNFNDTNNTYAQPLVEVMPHFFLHDTSEWRSKELGYIYWDPTLFSVCIDFHCTSRHQHRRHHRFAVVREDGYF